MWKKYDSFLSYVIEMLVSSYKIIVIDSEFYTQVKRVKVYFFIFFGLSRPLATQDLIVVF